MGEPMVQRGGGEQNHIVARLHESGLFGQLREGPGCPSGDAMASWVTTSPREALQGLPEAPAGSFQTARTPD